MDSPRLEQVSQRGFAVSILGGKIQSWSDLTVDPALSSRLNWRPLKFPCNMSETLIFRIWHAVISSFLTHNVSAFWLITSHSDHRLCKCIHMYIHFYTCGRKKWTHQQKRVEHYVISCHKGKIFITELEIFSKY